MYLALLFKVWNHEPYNNEYLILYSFIVLLPNQLVLEACFLLWCFQVMYLYLLFFILENITPVDSLFLTVVGL